MADKKNPSKAFQPPRVDVEITATLEPATGWTRQTVITLLKRMTEKGAVSMDEAARAKTYVSLITRKEASTTETHKFLNHVFKGKASLLVNHLVDNGDLSAEDLQEILNILHDAGGKVNAPVDTDND